jgi:hypothetical protein
MAEQDVLKRTTGDIRARLKELEPLVREHERLQAALSALEGSGGQKSQPRRGRGGTGPRRRQTSSGRASRGERRQQLLRVVQAEPGVRPSKAAHQMGINPAQLHSLSRRLEEAGELQRRDGGLYLAPPDAAVNGPQGEAH